MAAKEKKFDLVVRVRLEESEGHKLPEKLPKTAVHAFDENGEFLSSVALSKGEAGALKATLTLPSSMKNRSLRLALGAPTADIYEGVPPWATKLIQDSDTLRETSGGEETRRGAVRKSAPVLASLIGQGAREKRVRLTKDLAAYDVALYPGDWLEWFKCRCEVQGRLVRRVPLPDGTTKEVGICHACILIYEVDSFPKLVARLPERDLFRLRDDLARLKEVFELPPKELPQPYEPPVPPIPPLPFRATAAAARNSGLAALPKTAIAGLGPQPEPPDLPAAMNLQPLSSGGESMAELDKVFVAGSAVELRNALIDKAALAIRFICYFPWLHHWYHKDLIRCVCTDEDGRFSTTIWYTCSGDKPDLYFKAVQCIGGSLHTLYDPGVACHTHWNYVCGTEVVLETTDPAARVCAPADPVQPPPGTTPWVMPFGVGGTRVDRIQQPSGLVDYTQSSTAITDAPFGGTLGLRHGYSSVFPTPGMTHYRWQYKKEEAGSPWREFAEPVAAPVVRHYVDEDLSDPSQPPTFPAYAVGPHSIAGKHLYEFKPDEPPQIPGHNRYWPTDNWFGEIYSGILRSRSLPGGLDLAAGKYKIKLEVFDGSGNRVAPSPGTFRFIVPTGVASDGVTILSRNAYASEIEDDGFIFYLHIDNRSCDAVIDGPTANGTVADDACGFLRFGVGDQVSIAFHATHPANFAYFHFWIRRGIQIVSNVFDDVDAPSVASSTSPAHSYGGDGSGNFAKTNFTPGQLLDTCPEAAFAEILRTRAKATNGWHRLDAYDAGHERAFALAPKKP